MFTQRFQAIGMGWTRRSFAPIVGLRFGCRPLAIVRRVGSIVVDAIQGVCRRWFAAHVGKKGIERSQPPCADRDASAAVSLEVWILWIGAALLHACPRFIFWRVPRAVSESCTAASTPFFGEAAAGCRMAVAHHQRLASAITAGMPIAARADLMRKRNDGEPALTFASHIARFRAFGHV